VRTNLIANALILAFGTPTAWFIARRQFRGRALVVTLVELPLVLPPAVAGIGLLAAVGTGGLFGSELRDAGIQLPFTEAAVVLAVAFVASPFYIRLRVRRHHAHRRRAHARRRPRADVLEDRAPAGRRRAAGRLGAGLRPRRG
jgi:molybdate transport system permease protein